jgi:hypothetical protein
MSLRKILQAADKAADQAVTFEQAATLEGSLREFVRRDVISSVRQHNEANAAADPGALIPLSRNQPSTEHLNALIGPVSAASLEEIDRVILELQHMQGMLRREGERLCQDLSGYASLNQAAMTAMKVIGDSLKQWSRGTADETPADHVEGAA